MWSTGGVFHLGVAQATAVLVIERGKTRRAQDSATIQLEGEMDPLIKALAAYPVIDLETERPSLEEVFLTLYE